MKRKAFLLITLLVLTMSSCVYSLFPIYTIDTIVYRPELLGEWKLTDDDTYMRFESAKILKEVKAAKRKADLDSGKTPDFNFGDFGVNNGSNNEIDRAKTYLLTITDSNSITSHNEYRVEYYEAHLVDIDGTLFLDILPIRAAVNKDVSHDFIPMHTFMKFDIKGNDFVITPFESKKLLDLFNSNLIRLRHEKLNDQVIITAQPKELQKFLSRYSEDESVFDDAQNYHKL